MLNKVRFNNANLIFSNNNLDVATINLDSNNYMSLNLSKFTNVLTPINSLDVANKYYVDNAILSLEGIPLGIASLDSNGWVYMAQMNPDVQTFIYDVQSINQMNAIVNPSQGTIVRVLLQNTTYIYNKPTTTWVQILSPDLVTSVNSQIGNVVLTSDNIPQGSINLYYTNALFLNSISSITTDNINEGIVNLYYTDTRVNSNTNVIASINHIANLNNPHDVTKAQVGLGYVSNILNNYSATRSPTNNDDITYLYSVGSTWCNINSNESYICLNPTQYNAVWKLGSATTTDDLIIGNNQFYTQSLFNASFAAETTSNLLEGSNLYYTLARFNLAFSETTTDSLAEGIVNLYYTDARVNNNTNVSLSTIHRSLLNNPHEVTQAQVGLGYVPNLKCNLTATIPPTPSNDINQQYSVGSSWIDIVSNRQYTCVNNSAGNAIWKLISEPVEYDAVVDVNGDGDFTSISAAFEAGNRSIFVKQGYYYQATNINVPDGGVIVGDAPGLVYIIFIGTTGLYADGSGGVIESRGTVSITSGSQIVTGINTFFTNIPTSSYILLENTFYFIQEIISDTMLALRNIYFGNTLTNITFLAQFMLAGVIFRNLIILASENIGLYMRALYHSVIDTVTVMMCETNFSISYCGSTILTCVASIDAGNNGIELHNTYGVSISLAEISNNANNGIYITDYSTQIVIGSLTASANGNIGIMIDNSSNNTIIQNAIVTNNKSHGIYCTSLTNGITFSNLLVNYNTGYGIYILGSNNAISNTSITQNGGTGVYVTNESIVSDCIINLNGGDGLYMGTNNNAVGNYITYNTSNGVTINGNNVIFSSNYVCNNTQNGIYANNTVNILINSNYISTNGVNGIFIQESTCAIISNCKCIENVVGFCINSNSTRVVLDGNIAKGNTSNGFVISGNEATLNSNVSLLNGSVGCVICTGAVDSLLLGNRFYDNTGLDFVDNGTIVSTFIEYINNLDSRINCALTIGATNATQITIGQTGINTTIAGSLTINQNLNVDGTINGYNFNAQITSLDDHLVNYSNPHQVTQTQIGLGNLTNDLQIPYAQKGANNGVATLNSNGKIPVSQLYQCDSYGFNSNTNMTNYTRVFQFIYPGTTNEYSIINIKIISYIDAYDTSNLYYNLQVWDYTNMNIIAQQTNQNNTGQIIIDMGTIQNLPTSYSIFEIQASVQNVSNTCYILGALITFG